MYGCKRGHKKKSLEKYITERDGLNMNDVVGKFTGSNIGATFFRESKPIDAVWTTPDIVVVGACVILAGYGIGNLSLTSSHLLLLEKRHH